MLRNQNKLIWATLVAAIFVFGSAIISFAMYKKSNKQPKNIPLTKRMITSLEFQYFRKTKNEKQ